MCRPYRAPIGACRTDPAQFPPQFDDTRRILQECSATIAREVESVRTLVDEFSQFTRFPAAQPVPSDLNQIVDNALAVFEGRLDGISVEKDLEPELPWVQVDREQFKRVVVNLVDNAAEAMQDSLVKRLYIGTRSTEADVVELIVADTGCGVSREDKEKLFLPYFSTKGRGTGLGLAIVNRILADHESTHPRGGQSADWSSFHHRAPGPNRRRDGSQGRSQSGSQSRRSQNKGGGSAAASAEIRS